MILNELKNKALLFSCVKKSMTCPKLVKITNITCPKLSKCLQTILTCPKIGKGTSNLLDFQMLDFMTEEGIMKVLKITSSHILRERFYIFLKPNI